MPSEKGKGLAVLLGIGKPKAGEGGGADETDDQALTDAGDNFIMAFKEGDALGVAQAVLDIVDIGR